MRHTTVAFCVYEKYLYFYIYTIYLKPARIRYLCTAPRGWIEARTHVPRAALIWFVFCGKLHVLHFASCCALICGAAHRQVDRGSKTAAKLRDLCDRRARTNESKNKYLFLILHARDPHITRASAFAVLCSQKKRRKEIR